MDNKKLTAALEKKAVYGNDIDLSSYSDSDKGSLKSVDDLSEATRGRLEYVGIETGAAEEESRSASFVQLDNNAVEIKVKKQTPLEKLPKNIRSWWKNTGGRLCSPIPINILQEPPLKKSRVILSE